MILSNKNSLKKSMNALNMGASRSCIVGCSGCVCASCGQCNCTCNCSCTSPCNCNCGCIDQKTAIHNDSNFIMASIEKIYKN